MDNLCSFIFIFIFIGTNAAPSNPFLLLDMYQNNPGDLLIWQQSKYSDPNSLSSLGYNAIVSTGEMSNTLAVDFHTLDNNNYFPEGSPSRSWLDTMTSGIQEWIDRVAATKQQIIFFTDMIVLPNTVITAYKQQIVDPNTNKILWNNITMQLLSVMINETFTKFPQTSGFMIRTGETYVYDTPYHTGNSPIVNINDQTQQQQIWISFINFLRSEVCVKWGKILIFRTWDNFGGWDSPPDYYLNVMNNVEPSPLLYISIKHTSGDFFRTMNFNAQLGIGTHAQIVEVELQREYEGKGAHPSYVLHLVLDGDFSAPNSTLRYGLNKVVGQNVSTSVIRGIWSWSRGGGWWGPYVKGNEFWIDLHVRIVSSYWNNLIKGVNNISEATLFEQACQTLLNTKDTNACGYLRQIALYSADANLYGHYCMEGDYGSCYTWTRDDRLGGLNQLNSHFNYIFNNTLQQIALDHKQNSTVLWDKMVQTFNSLSPLISSADLRLQIGNSITYGELLFEIIYAGWQVMTYGLMTQRGIQPPPPPNALNDAISAYDNAWAKYKAFSLSRQQLPSLYQGVYWNAPQQPSQPGLDATVDQFRNLTNPKKVL